MSDRRSDRLPLSGLRPHQGGILVLTLDFRGAWEMQPFIFPIILWLAAAFVQRYVCLRHVSLDG